MAIFEGTIQEFHDYLGPRIRNKINNLTRSHRKALNNVCQHCGETGELESAHKHGFNRRDIIENVLSEYKNGEYIKCDIFEVEGKIIYAHYPIKEKFIFLCSSCHKKYDKSTHNDENFIPKSDPVNYINNKMDEKMENSAKFNKIDRIEKWAKHPEQINHKIIKAFLRLSRVNDIIKLTDLKKLCSYENENFYVKKFDINFASMKTDAGNSHGKVFKEDNGIVTIYETVLREINRYFK